MNELLILLAVIVVFAAGVVVGAACASDRLYRHRRDRVVKVDHGLDALSRVGGGHA